VTVESTLAVLQETNAVLTRRELKPAPSRIWFELVDEGDAKHRCANCGRINLDGGQWRGGWWCFGCYEAAAVADEQPSAGLSEAGRLTLCGGDWILDAPTETPAVWGGASGTVAWSKGEGLMLVGPEGVGKTTLVQQLVLARIGLRSLMLGMHVEIDERPVLYIAADRARQAQRSFARMVTAADRDLLNERLRIWKGPLPFDLAGDPSRLTALARSEGVGTVVIDSLKDVALDLVKDEVGSRVNLAVQELVAADIEACVIHHQRKGRDGQRPKKLEDVYGSRWLTAGMGSVLLVWGEPGDLVVDLNHLKQPSEEIGPLQLLHDHGKGRTTIYDEIDLLALAEAAGAEGLLVFDAAGAMFRTDQPDKNEIEKARRRLDRLADQGQLEKDDSQKPKPARYRLFGQRA
jgi:replicative DNA helicase